MFSNLNANLEFLSQFHGPLHIKNESTNGASVYYGQILVLILLLVRSITFNFSNLITYCVSIEGSNVTSLVLGLFGMMFMKIVKQI